MIKLRFTRHAWKRCSARSIPQSYVEMVMDWGQEFYRAGAVFHFLGKKMLQKFGIDRNLWDRLEGLVIVTDPYSGVVLTGYRNHKAPKRIKRKLKRSRSLKQKGSKV
jgi:hypothetical protein